MRYECPFCYKTMPEGYVPSAWACCGEVGHAVAMPSTPRTEEVCLGSWEFYQTDSGYACAKVDYEAMANHACQLERELNAALIAAGVASLERGEWATERDDLNQRIREWRDICEKHDAKLTKVLVESDAAEEVISEIYFRIMGRSPEWSNLFGHKQAVEEIVETFDMVRACLKVWRKD